MKVTIEQIQKGIAQYIDMEISPKLSGWEKIGFCTVSALLIKNLQTTFEKYKENSFVQMLGIADADGSIDIDSLRDAIATNLKEEYVNIPVIKMRLKVTESDLNRLCTMIKEA